MATIEKKIVVDIIKRNENITENYHMLYVYQSSTNITYKFKVDYDIIEYLQLFRWNIARTNTHYPYYSAKIDGQVIEIIALFKVILGIHPLIKCYVTFKNGDITDYQRSNLLVYEYHTNVLVQPFTYYHKPPLKYQIFPAIYSGLQAINHTNDHINYMLKTEIPGIDKMYTIVNYRFLSILNKFSWAIIRSKSHKNSFYYSVNSNDKALINGPNGEKRNSISIHRFLVSLVNPSFNIFDSSIFIDHIDRNSLNNTIENLRICTPAENCKNQLRLDGSSGGYPGVWKAGNKWVVEIGSNGIRYNFGRYDTLQEAVEVRNREVVKLHGEFAVVVPYHG